MKPLFDLQGNWTNDALKLSKDMIDVLEPIMRKAMDEGCTAREISHIALLTVTEIELNVQLDYKTGEHRGPRFDPIQDEEKDFDLETWARTLMNEVRLYANQPEKNAFHQAKHKWSEWMGTFARYMSW